VANKTAEDIQITREGYVPIAIRGSVLYFAMAGLRSITINTQSECALESIFSPYTPL